MKSLTIIANIKAKPDQIEFVKTELLKLIDLTRSEKGCLDYILHQDNNNPSHFLFYENWESKQFLQEHLQSDHLKEYVKNTKNSVEEFSINEMTLLK